MKNSTVIIVCFFLSGLAGYVGYSLKECPALPEVTTTVDIIRIEDSLTTLLIPRIRKELEANLPHAKVKTLPAKIVYVKDTVHIEPKQHEWYIAEVDSQYTLDSVKMDIHTEYITTDSLTENGYFWQTVKMIYNKTKKVEHSIQEIEVPEKFYKDHWFWTTIFATLIAIASLLGGH